MVENNNIVDFGHLKTIIETMDTFTFIEHFDDIVEPFLKLLNQYKKKGINPPRKLVNLLLNLEKD